ncbi:hypothetical protein M2352_000537 [Azospirillum fermentarium]|uniref:hypothetical protein n=1 Tax=Azospirillum fermentarium TaxID=1233114 RepID=UPI0022274335|nr:hypothetical protein [Azospirillum fermentarium]MCW2244946.1 hypothetical protein [Azospirillum fermentarium]
MTGNVDVALPNATDVHVASEDGLVLVSGATAVVITVNIGAVTVKVNVDRDRPAFVEGAHYRIGGQLSGKGEFAVPKGAFKGYGMGPEDHVAIFIGQIGAPQ